MKTNSLLDNGFFLLILAGLLKLVDYLSDQDGMTPIMSLIISAATMIVIGIILDVYRFWKES